MKVEEGKIIGLKCLSMAYDIAIEYGSCDVDNLEDALEVVNVDNDDLEFVLNRYKGWSCLDIENEVFRKIKDL